MNNFPKKRTNPFETPIKAPKEEKIEKVDEEIEETVEPEVEIEEPEEIIEEVIEPTPAPRRTAPKPAPKTAPKQPKTATRGTYTYVESDDRQKYTATMDVKLRRRIKVVCAQRDIMFSQFIEMACIEKLEREGER